MVSVCVASHHASFAELLADAEFRDLARREGCLLELRLDQYADRSAAGLEEATRAFTPGRLVVTFRSPDEGGHAPGASDEERLGHLRAAARLGAAWVDVELATLRRAGLKAADVRAGGASRVAVSFHDFAGVPPQARLRELRREAEAAGADLVKLAVHSKVLLDAAPLLELLGEETPWNRPLLGLAMGEAGFWSRVLGPRFPHATPFTFAHAETAPGTAPGQPIWRELETVYRFRRITPGTPVYGVIGNPIAHSLSPLMHNAALAALDLDGVYLPFKLESDPAGFVREFAPRLGVRGLSVTIPHKEAVASACAEVDALARSVGAINTLVRRADAWFATNTDARAAAGSLEAALGGPGALQGRRVVILGAGGAARAVAFGVRELGAEVGIHNRSRERAEKLAHETGGQVVSKEELSKVGFAAAIVNTTPVGMHPRVDETPLQENELPGGSLIFDTVYNPLCTKLLRWAEARGLRTLSGLEMFVGQGAAQFELFTGRTAPIARMRAVVLAELEERERNQ